MADRVSATSERAVLAAVMESPVALKTAATRLSADSFYDQRHRQLWEIITRLREQGIRPEPRVVSVEAGKVTPLLPSAVVELATVGPTGSLDYHLRQIEDAAMSRALTATLTNGLQRAEEGRPPAEVVAEMRAQLEVVARYGDVDSSTAVDILDFVAQADSDDDWVIPPLLARHDRFILTGPEGGGKSTLLRQIAVCTASGVHPFTGVPIPPRRVLVVDAENPDRVNRRGYRPLLAAVHGVERGMLTLEATGPRNLLDPRDAARLYADVERVEPDLVVVGPLYQLHQDDPNEERNARALTVVLDKVRLTGKGCALILEAHTPHRDGHTGHSGRPVGSSLWMRWPDFGMFMRDAPDADDAICETLLSAWRGGRDIRPWPRQIERGGRMPWSQSP